MTSFIERELDYLVFEDMIRTTAIANSSFPSIQVVSRRLGDSLAIGYYFQDEQGERTSSNPWAFDTLANWASNSEQALELASRYECDPRVEALVERLIEKGYPISFTAST